MISYWAALTALYLHMGLAEWLSNDFDFKRSTRQCARIWSDNLQLPYTRRLEIIWHQRNLPTCLLTTSKFLTNAMVIIFVMVIMVKIIIMVEMSCRPPPWCCPPCCPCPPHCRRTPSYVNKKWASRVSKKSNFNKDQCFTGQGPLTLIWRMRGGGGQIWAEIWPKF